MAQINGIGEQSVTPATYLVALHDVHRHLKRPQMSVLRPVFRGWFCRSTGATHTEPQIIGPSVRDDELSVLFIRMAEVDSCVRPPLELVRLGWSRKLRGSGVADLLFPVSLLYGLPVLR